METCLKDLGYGSAKRSGRGGGGCISQGEMFHTDKGKVFVKKNTQSGARTMFEGEMASLSAIEKTNAIKVPHPIAVVDNPEGPGALLIMEYLDMKHSVDQEELGKAIAQLHLDNRSKEGTDSYVSQFGFHVPTCCGYIPQSNGFTDDWSTFYSNKLEEQISQLKDNELQQLWPRLKDKLPTFFAGLEIKPSLLHGDMWSGNVAQCADKPVVFDAASFYGHDEYDLGIAGMFGGFSRDFYDAYHRLIPKAAGFEQRHSLYELFHNLNHWNHFGAGYRSSSIRIIKSLL